VFGEQATHWLFDEDEPVIEKSVICMSLFVGRERYIVNADRSLPVSWLVSELIRQYTNRHGVEDPGIIGLRRMGSVASCLKLQASIGTAVGRKNTVTASPTSSSALVDVTNVGARPAQSHECPKHGETDIATSALRWGEDETIQLVAVVRHPSQAPEIIKASDDKNVMTYQFDDGEVIEVEELMECEAIRDVRRSEPTHETASRNSWQEIKTYVVQEGGKFVQKKMQEAGLAKLPDVKCDGWFHPERFPDGKRLTEEDLVGFYTWMPKIDPYMGGDSYRKNLNKIDVMLTFGPAEVATCDHELVEKLIIKYDGTWVEKGRIGFHRQRLEDWFEDRREPPKKKNVSIFIEEDEENIKPQLRPSGNNRVIVAETTI